MKQKSRGREAAPARARSARVFGSGFRTPRTAQPVRSRSVLALRSSLTAAPGSAMLQA